jgi:hypothetical protein
MGGLPGAFAPASIALRVIGEHKSPFHEMAVFLEEELLLLLLLL